MLKSKKSLKDKNVSVCVVFLAEYSVEASVEVFKTLRDQVYKNVEYVVAYVDGFDIKAFETKIHETTDIDSTTIIKYVTDDRPDSLLDKAVAMTEAEIVFVKTLSPTTWYPWHIVNHVEKHQDAKLDKSIVLSNIEKKNSLRHNEDPFGTLAYRITKKLTSNDILLDEMSFCRSIEPNLIDCLYFIDSNGNGTVEEEKIAKKVFDTAKAYRNIMDKAKKLLFTDELTIVVHEPFYDKEILDQMKPSTRLTQPDWQTLNTEQTVREDYTIKHMVPTIFGNTQLDQDWNNKMREHMREHIEEILAEPQKRVVIKRTVGMGDVIQAEPVVRYYKDLGFEVWFVTSDSRGCQEALKRFVSKPDVVLPMNEGRLTQDVLGKTNLPALLTENGFDPIATEFDLRIDLDLAYESRPGKKFVDAYFDTIDVPTDKRPLDYDRPMMAPLLEDSGKPAFQHKTMAVCLNGSGWGGKEIDVESAGKILSKLKEAGYQLAHVSSITPKYESLKDMFDIVNASDDYSTMFAWLDLADGYVGADNGPMHVAMSLSQRCLAWNGAALVEMTAGGRADQAVVLKKDLKCLGCKHKSFFELVQPAPGQVTLTFLPICVNSQPFECMNGFTDEQINGCVSEFLDALQRPLKLKKIELL